MSHDLFRNRMAFVDDVPWHALGERVPANVSAPVMCEAAGLDWSVAKVPAPGARLTNQHKGTYDRYLICRDPLDDEDEPVALGMVRAGYEPLQNIEAFRFFEPLIDTGYAQFHTAGALANGEKVWVLAKLQDQIVVGDNDTIDRFLLLSNSHDGSGAVSVRFTPIRVVCQNTLNLAVKEGGKNAISIRQTRHIQRHMANAQAEQLRAVVERVFSDAAKLFSNMTLRRVSVDERLKILNEIFPLPPARSSTARPRGLPERWQRVEHLLGDESVTPPETAETAWGLYNAITRDEDYRATREGSPDARLNRIWFGSGQDIKIKALETFRELVKESA